jgi:hypothetical protein
MVRQIGEAAQTVADLAGEHVARPEVEAADQALAAATDAIQDIVRDANGADLAAAAAAWQAIASAQDTVAAAQAAVARARGQGHVAHEQRARASRLAALQGDHRCVTVVPAAHAANGYLVTVEPGHRSALVRPDAPDDEWAEHLRVLGAADEPV